MEFGKILNDSWTIFRSNAVAYIVGLLIAIFGSVFIITIAPLMYGFTYMAYKGTKGEKVEIADVLYGFKHAFVKSWILFLGMFIPIFLISSIVTYFVGQNLGLIVETIISILLTYALALLVIRDYTAIDAIKESLEIVQKNPVETIILFVITFALITVGTLALIIGMLITIPIAEIFLVYVTKELMKIKPVGLINS